MKAVVLERAGSADRLMFAEIPKPSFGPGEVLIRVHATTVTRGDVVLRKMPKTIARLVGETPKSVLGHEFAGEIVASGADVDDLRVGDRVFGTTSARPQGSHAEYVSMPGKGILATIPVGIEYDEAAPIPVGAMTALHFLLKGGARAGHRVLINGASGSVGTYAVQIAKGLGAHVTGVSSAANMDLVASLGADETIDYQTHDFTKGSQRYDLVFDTVAKLAPKSVTDVLSEQGSFVSTRSRRKETIEELLLVRDLLMRRVIWAVIDRCFALEDLQEAHRYVELGRKRGNVLVTMTEGDRDFRNT